LFLLIGGGGGIYVILIACTTFEHSKRTLKNRFFSAVAALEVGAQLPVVAMLCLTRKVVVALELASPPPNPLPRTPRTQYLW
jgi:hypothetical protein